MATRPSTQAYPVERLRPRYRPRDKATVFDGDPDSGEGCQPTARSSPLPHRRSTATILRGPWTLGAMAQGQEKSDPPRI